MTDDRCKPLQDPSSCRRSKRRQPDNGAHKKRFNKKINLAVDAHGIPAWAIIKEGSRTDCTQIDQLIKGTRPDYLDGR